MNSQLQRNAFTACMFLTVCVSFVSNPFIMIYNTNENMEAQNSWYLPSVNASVQVMWSFVRKKLVLSRSSRVVSQLRRCHDAGNSRRAAARPSRLPTRPSPSPEAKRDFPGLPEQGRVRCPLGFSLSGAEPLPKGSALLRPRGLSPAERPVKLLTLRPGSVPAGAQG